MYKLPKEIQILLVKMAVEIYDAIYYNNMMDNINSD